MAGGLSEFTREEVSKHCTRQDQWIILDGFVYDVTKWAPRHPGGARLLGAHSGQDATDAWRAFHIDLNKVGKYLPAMRVGTVSASDPPVDFNHAPASEALMGDFRNLRSSLEKQGYFRASRVFFALTLGHILLLEAIGWLIFWQWGVNLWTVLASALVLTAMQAQAGWHQHDLGHLSVFPSSKWNHVFHKFVIGVTKAASADWWNYRHFQHHAKPNLVMKDPDITIPYMFLFGSSLPYDWGLKKRGVMPYNWQHLYFFLTFPPLLLPIYFHYENIHYCIKKRAYWDFFCTGLFFVKHFYLYTPFMGFWGAFWFYMFVRFLESHWFVWVTQMNHIPMEVEKDSGRDWVSMQLAATCNVHGGAFNDWFTGHLNFQIEHHLFPTMPRHNYPKVAGRVRELCAKHGLHYQSKTLFGAFADIVRSLEKSGEIWLEAYSLA